MQVNVAKFLVRDVLVVYMSDSPNDFQGEPSVTRAKNIKKLPNQMRQGSGSSVSQHPNGMAADGLKSVFLGHLSC